MKKINYYQVVLFGLLIIWTSIIIGSVISQTENLGGRSINLIPIVNLIWGNEWLEGLKNIFLFISLGYLLAALFAKPPRLLKVLTKTIWISLGIEIIQYILAKGSADTNDLITASAGSILGLGVYLLFSNLFKGKKQQLVFGGLILVLSVGLYRSFDQIFQQDSFLAFTAEAQTENSEQDQGWELLLVNQANPIPEDYEVTLEKLSNGQMIDQRIYAPLQEMFDAARKSGVYPVIVSGYRSAEEQQKLLDEKKAAYLAEGYSKKQAKEKAEQWVAIPGTSEHQLGISIDINEDKLHSSSTEVYNWLKQNAHKFGFINRYPVNKTAITGVINEPWHYRYVGIEAATEISEQGLCLEEYVTR